jgi:hypothetical protein
LGWCLWLEVRLERSASTGDLHHLALLCRGMQCSLNPVHNLQYKIGNQLQHIIAFRHRVSENLSYNGFSLNTPLDLSSRTSLNRAPKAALYRKSSNTQSYQGSISNSSVHTTSTAATRKDLFDYPEQGPGGVSSISHRKSFHSLENPTFRFKNQPQFTVGTIREAGFVRSSTAISTPKEEIRSLNIPSFEDEDESLLPSTPRSSVYNLFKPESPIPARALPSSQPLPNSEHPATAPKLPPPLPLPHQQHQHQH